MINICERCDRDYETKRIEQRYCGNECRLKVMKGLNARLFQKDRHIKEDEPFQHMGMTG